MLVLKILNMDNHHVYECSLAFCFFPPVFTVSAETEYGSRAPLKDAVSFLSKYSQLNIQ